MGSPAKAYREIERSSFYFCFLECKLQAARLSLHELMSTQPPIGVQAQEIPHLVLLTFDDSIIYCMIPIYEWILQNRQIPYDLLR